MDSTEREIGIKEAARLAARSPQTIRLWMRRKILPHSTSPEGYLVFKESDVRRVSGNASVNIYSVKTQAMKSHYRPRKVPTKEEVLLQLWALARIAKPSMPAVAACKVLLDHFRDEQDKPKQLIDGPPSWLSEAS